jgi:hypothetical protein
MSYWWQSQRERDHYEGQDIYEWIMIDLAEIGWRRGVLIGFVWIRIGTSGELL